MNSPRSLNLSHQSRRSPTHGLEVGYDRPLTGNSSAADIHTEILKAVIPLLAFR